MYFLAFTDQYRTVLSEDAVHIWVGENETGIIFKLTLISARTYLPPSRIKVHTEHRSLVTLQLTRRSTHRRNPQTSRSIVRPGAHHLTGRRPGHRVNGLRMAEQFVASDIRGERPQMHRLVRRGRGETIFGRMESQVHNGFTVTFEVVDESRTIGCKHHVGENGL